jgi:tetratricopeptide (TPR) repeat protein
MLSITGLVVQELPAIGAATAARLADQKQWGAAEGHAREAADADGSISAYLMAAGLAAARAGNHATAWNDFNRVAQRDDLPEAWVNLAAEHVQLGDVHAARDSLRSAARLGLRRPAVAMAIAGLALQLGMRDLAIEATAAAVRANPTIAADPWWQAYVGREPALDAAIDSIFGDPAATSLRWQIALMRGDGDAARQLASGDPDASFSVLVIEAWLGDATASVGLLASCRAAPLDEDRLVWCARVASHLGNARETFAMRQLLEVLGPGLSGRAGLLRVDVDGAGAASGNMARFWGIFTYRRATPLDMLVPSLVHLRLD